MRPISASCVSSLTIDIAWVTEALSGPKTVTLPESSTSILAPVVSWIARITLPPGPMMSRMRSGLIWIVSMRGAKACSSVRARRPGEIRRVLVHAVEDVEATGAGLLERLLHDVPVDLLDLDVHLQGGDARRASRRP